MARRTNPYRRGSFSRGGRGHGLSTSRTLEQLREMGEHVVQAAKDALKQGAEIVVADAKNRCPVKTGKLRDSIHAEPNRDGSVYKIVADAFHTDREGQKYYYGGRVEFDPDFGNPYLYPALDAHKLEVMKMVEDAASDAIRRGH